MSSPQYCRGYRAGYKAGEDLALHVAEHGHAVIAGMFRVSPERYEAAREFTHMYVQLRAEWRRDPSRDIRVRVRRLRWLQCVARDLWKRAA